MSFFTNQVGVFCTSPLSTSSDYIVQIGAKNCKYQFDTVRLDGLTSSVFTKHYFLERFEEGEVIPLENVLFKVGTAEMLPTSFVALDGLITLMKLNSSLKIRIDGHTDNSANKTTSIKISKERAEAVKVYLTRKNIPSKRIMTNGVGATHALVPNTSEENREKNRRVEFVILKV